MTPLQAGQLLNSIQFAAQERKAPAQREVTNKHGETRMIACMPGRRVGWRNGFVRTNRDALFDWLVGDEDSACPY